MYIPTFEEMNDVARDDNICIDFVDNLAIFMNENGELFYAELPIAAIDIGEAMDTKNLKSIKTLPDIIQKRIIDTIS